ncbi:MAG: 3-methyl-2-oxobutanoate hydroxymethyltransferase [Acidobacteria bacterium]|nr:MAG: 3-methyl-2-oxobutanoate hydroxymethyltransferase [Acidobacteriota bacterium]
MSTFDSTSRVTVPLLLQRKQKHEKITMLTTYDYPSACILDRSQTDIALVGDSLSMVVLGHENTLSIGMDEMIYHTKAVVRACRRALVVGDMPFGSYQNGITQAVENGIRFIKEGGCAAVKLEGGKQRASIIAALVQAEVPVMGHVGMTPQSMHRFGGFRTQGKTVDAALAIMEDAFAVQEAGAFSVVLESIPAPVAAEITARLKIPTIGIGAGPHCDGQVLVWHDLFGMLDQKPAKFVKQYAQLYSEMLEATDRYCEEVRNGVYPDEAHSYSMVDTEAFAHRVEEVYGDSPAHPSNEGSFQRSKV